MEIGRGHVVAGVLIIGAATGGTFYGYQKGEKASRVGAETVDGSVPSSSTIAGNVPTVPTVAPGAPETTTLPPPEFYHLYYPAAGVACKEAFADGTVGGDDGTLDKADDNISGLKAMGRIAGNDPFYASIPPGEVQPGGLDRGTTLYKEVLEQSAVLYPTNPAIGSFEFGNTPPMSVRVHFALHCKLVETIPAAQVAP